MTDCISNSSESRENGRIPFKLWNDDNREYKVFDYLKPQKREPELTIYDVHEPVVVYAGPVQSDDVKVENETPRTEKHSVVVRQTTTASIETSLDKLSHS